MPLTETNEWWIIKTCWTYNHLQTIWDKQVFMWITRKVPFFVQEIFASNDEIFISGGGLSTR